MRRGKKEREGVKEGERERKRGSAREGVQGRK